MCNCRALDKEYCESFVLECSVYRKWKWRRNQGQMVIDCEPRSQRSHRSQWHLSELSSFWHYIWEWQERMVQTKYERNRLPHWNWLIKVDSKAGVKLQKLVQNTLFSNDVAKLSPCQQTSSLEAFHSLVIQFAPKSIAFSYMGMMSRYSNQNIALPLL